MKMKSNFYDFGDGEWIVHDFDENYINIKETYSDGHIIEWKNDEEGNHIEMRVYKDGILIDELNKNEIEEKVNKHYDFNHIVGGWEE